MTSRKYLRFVFPLLGFLAASSIAFGQSAGDAPKVKAQSAAVTDLNEILNSTNKASFWTRPVRLTGVKVQKVLDTPVILIGPDEKRMLPVMLDKTYAQLRQGSTIDVSGMIQELSPDLSQWNVNEPTRQALRPYPIFVNALKVEVRQ